MRVTTAVTMGTGTRVLAADGTGTGIVLMGAGLRVGVGVGLLTGSLVGVAVAVAQADVTQGVLWGVGVVHMDTAQGVALGVAVALLTWGVRVASPPGGFGLGPVGVDMAAKVHTSAATMTATIPIVHFVDILIPFLLPPISC